ncbi:hypothetical protein G6514_004714 [Epicoccum nigrum]|nr:hypothetical protein G6514_004714 [Epicoccum nigrum]
MPGLKSVIQVLFVALLAPWLYDRYHAFSPMLANRPSLYQNLNTFKSHDIKYRDQLRNCEDVIIERSLGLAFLSCDPGRDRWNTVMGTFKPENPATDKAGIYIYDYATPGLPDSARLKPLPIDDTDLHPLGLAFDAWTSTLYVANHARNRPSHLLILHVDLSSLTTTLISHFTHPLLHAPNAIHILGNHQLYVTNDHFLRSAVSPLGSKIETFSGAPGGTVVYVDTRAPAASRIVARVPFANGIEALNESTIAVASCSKAGVYLFEKDEQHNLQLRKVVRTSAAVDNLSTESDGKLLLAGHPFAPSLMKLSQGRAACAGDESEACKCGSPSWAAEWSEEGGLVELYKDDGTEFCSSSTVVRDSGKGVGIVSGLYERGILVFEP